MTNSEWLDQLDANTFVNWLLYKYDEIEQSEGIERWLSKEYQGKEGS